MHSQPRSDTPQFWEARARRFAGSGAGLRAVCSYAMPGFYNWAIDVTQRRAMRALLDSVGPGSSVLDYGCGIGRWSRAFARRGAAVTAIDFSETMIAEARRRTAGGRFEGRCEYTAMDVTDLRIGGRFDLVIGVTVLQHVLEDARRAAAIRALAERVKPGGRLVLFEAAPSLPDGRCDTATFRARPLATYLAAIEAAGLVVQEVRGVDPVPCKLWVLPRFKRWPRPLALAALAAATAVSLPLDLLLAPLLARRSWHKIIVCGAGSVR